MTAQINRVFLAQGLTKIYPMGDIQVQALHGVDLDLVLLQFCPDAVIDLAGLFPNL